jgi:hypothetical protein
MNSETPKKEGASSDPEGARPASKTPEAGSETEAPASKPENKEPESKASGEEREDKVEKPALATETPARDLKSKQAEPSKAPEGPETKASEQGAERKAPDSEPESKTPEPAPDNKGPDNKGSEPGLKGEKTPAFGAGSKGPWFGLKPRQEENKPPKEKRNFKPLKRFAKYAALIVMALVILRLVFDCYSFYAARRDIDAELQSKRVSSLEYLNVLSQRERALALSTLEARCLERAQLALFLITEVENDAIQKAFAALVLQKNEMIKTLRASGLDPAKVEKVTEYVDGPHFELFKLDEQIKELDDGTRPAEVFASLKKNLKEQREQYITIALKHAPLRERIEQTMRAYQAYGELIAQRNAMIKILDQSGLDAIKVRKATDHIEGSGFDLDLTKLDRVLAGLDPGAGHPTRGAYEKLRADIDLQRKRHIEIAMKHAPLRERIEPLLGAYPPSSPSFWTMDAIKAVVDRIDQLRKEHEANRARFGVDLDDVLARYAVWLNAATGGKADYAVLDDAAYLIGSDDTRVLRHARCDRFKDYYAAVNGRLLKDDLTSTKSWRELNWSETLATLYAVYYENLLWYFKKPPAAQTLMVTLLLGALGAITLNALRMSGVGWWSNHPDPFWGEIFVGPLLGALAAFGIFLVGSAGLLLTSDGRGAQPLSTYFIGLLGFVSGLLYDDAFGRVRRVGSQIFAGTSDVEMAAARKEDRTLAEALKGASASRAADLVLKYGIGTKLGTEKEFTLLLPSDEAMGALSLAQWNRLNEDGKAFDEWYGRHYLDQRLSRDDVTALKEKTKLKTGGDTTLDLRSEGGVLTVSTIRAVVPDVQWNKGVVHVLERDLPPDSSSDAAPALKVLP